MSPRIRTARRGRLIALAAVGAVAVAIVPAADAWAAGHGSHHGSSRVARHPLTTPTTTRSFSSPTPRVAAWAWGQAEHGLVVLPVAGGGTRTVLLQQGKVTATTATSVIVTSTDGFVATWTLGSTTAVAGLGGQRRGGHEARPFDVATTTTSTTTDPTATPALTAGLAKDQLVSAWGTLTAGGTAPAGSTGTADVVTVRPAPAVTTTTSTTSTTSPPTS